MADTDGAAKWKSPFLRITQEFVWRLGLVVYRRWYRLQVRGFDRLPASGPYLLVANHTSHLDGPAIIAAQKVHYRQVYSLGARDYFFRNPVLSWFSRYILNMIPIDRRRVDFHALKVCRLAATAGGILLMFPEGTRSTDGRLQHFKSGFGMFALRLGLPVVPVYIDGTFCALPKGRLLPRRSQITVTFGRAIRLQSDDRGAPPTKADYQRIAQEMRDTIARLQEEATPPPPLSRDPAWRSGPVVVR